MPNCDFLAAKPDLEAVLDFVFASGEYSVFESYSEPEQDLRKFSTVAEVKIAYRLGECAGTAPSVLLQLLASGTGTTTAERVALDPRRCEGKTFRFRASGWGLIQLYLGGVGPRGLIPSHTNHLSEAKARKYEEIHPSSIPVSEWNWREVEAASRRLNRFIHKQAIAKLGSRPVLPHAAAHLALAQ